MNNKSKFLIMTGPVMHAIYITLRTKPRVDWGRVCGQLHCHISGSSIFVARYRASNGITHNISPHLGKFWISPKGSNFGIY